jgi:hypothetical protein
MTIIYLTRFPECPAPRCRVRLIPEGFFSLSREKRAGNSSLCFVLHHMGFFLRSRLREDPVGSYPAFSPLPSTISSQLPVVSCQLSAEFTTACAKITLRSALEASDFLFLFSSTDHWQLTTNGAGRFIFCDTFRYPGFTPKYPRFHEACRLPVFGLSSGEKDFKPAIICHVGQNTIDRHRGPARRSAANRQFSDETSKICVSLSVRFPGFSGEGH